MIETPYSDLTDILKIYDSVAIIKVNALPNDCIELKYINVYPTNRQQGVGSAILAEICHFADLSKKNIKLLALEIIETTDTRVTNVDLVSWYKKYGFIDISEKTDMGVEMIRYCKK